MRLVLSPRVPADFIHIHNHVHLRELLRCGWGLRPPAVRHAVRRSKRRLVSVAPSAPSEPWVHTLPGNLGPFDKMQRQTLVGDPQPWWHHTNHATSLRPLQGPNEGDEGGGGRIKGRGNESSCSILPAFERNQHRSSHRRHIPYNQ